MIILKPVSFGDFTFKYRQLTWCDSTISTIFSLKKKKQNGKLIRKHTRYFSKNARSPLLVMEIAFLQEIGKLRAMISSCDIDPL